MENKTLIIGLAAIAVIGVAILAMSKPNTTSKAAVSPTAQVQQVRPSTTGEAMNGAYKAGKYTADGNYVSPAGDETVKVTVSLKADGTIQDVDFQGMAKHETSKKYQGLFASGYKPLVLGKKIDEVELDKVSGSSLAPKGFNDAIEKIKAEAKG